MTHQGLGERSVLAQGNESSTYQEHPLPLWSRGRLAIEFPKDFKDQQYPRCGGYGAQMQDWQGH
jgi:hypothetical protein